MSRYLLTVHGTWAREAEWASPSGPLERAVRPLLPDVQFEQFQWRGGNLNRDRLDGARRLEARLRELSAHDVVIVAHSHGGNVARSASALAGEGSGLRRIVAVGTPFLSIDLLDEPILRSETKALLRAMPLLLMRVALRRLEPKSRAVALFNRVQPGYGGRGSRVAGLVDYALGATFVMWALTTALGSAVSIPLRRTPVDVLVRTIDPPAPHAEILVVATPGDEASFALAVGQFLGFLSLRSSRGLIDGDSATSGLVGDDSITSSDVGDHTTDADAEANAKEVAEGFARALLHLPLVWVTKKLAGKRAADVMDQALYYADAAQHAALAIPLLVYWSDRLTTGWDGSGLVGRRIEGDGAGGERFTRVTVSPTPRGTHTVNMGPLPRTSEMSALVHSVLVAGDSWDQRVGRDRGEGIPATTREDRIAALRLSVVAATEAQ